ncbi:hypothetical protein BJX61DRAFT_545230 [Aspergillus egyptiacus]|nr:hypothetical protein BJX61DRAFT_545230 [Aspergillus egyptiacus]
MSVEKDDNRQEVQQYQTVRGRSPPNHVKWNALAFPRAFGPGQTDNSGNCASTTYRRGVAVTPPPSSSRLRRDSPTSISQQTTQEAESASTTPYGQSEREHPTDVADHYWGPTSAHSFLGWAVRDIPATSSNVVTRVRLADFEWPDKATAEALTRRYFDFACLTYGTLHQPTIEEMVHGLYENGTQFDDCETSPGESSASHAVPLMVFSTATMVQPGADGRLKDADELGWKISELYYAKAERLLSQETRIPTRQSVQARFLTVLYNR